MICPYCKAEIDDDAKKCKNCGEWVNKVQDFPQREFGKTVAFAFFFGIFGVHRFYTGYKKTGAIQLILTLTLLGIIISGIWAFVDLIKISLNKYKDSLNRPLLNYRKNFGIAIAIIASLCLILNICNAVDGWNMTDTTPAPASAPTSVGNVKSEENNADDLANSKGLELIEHHQCKDEYGSRAVCGTILNNTNKDYGYVQVSVNLYDASGNLVDSEFTNINDLEAGKNWKFEISITTDKPIKSYKIKEITGY